LREGDFRYFREGRRINLYLIRCPFPFPRVTSQFHGLWPDTPGRNWVPIAAAYNRKRKHPGTETEYSMVLACPFMSMVHGMLRQPHW